MLLGSAGVFLGVPGAVWVFQALCRCTQFALLRRVHSEIWVPGTWPAHAIRIIIAGPSHDYLCFRHLAGAQDLHFYCWFIVNIAFQALGSRTRFALLLRVHNNQLCDPGTWHRWLRVVPGRVNFVK